MGTATAEAIPERGAVPPGHDTGEFGFDFTRFGVRVPAVLVSPLIEAGTVFRVPAGTMPIDHTSILKTVQERWSLPSLTARDAAAPSLGGVLTLTTPRTDDALAGVTVPVSGAASPSAALPSHLQQVQADLISRQYPAGRHPWPTGSHGRIRAPRTRTTSATTAPWRGRLSEPFSSADLGLRVCGSPEEDEKGSALIVTR